MAWNSPWQLLSSYWPVQCHTCPWLSTMIRSEARTVWRRWAMVKVVQSWKELRMVSWIRPSVSASIAAVASSRIRTWRPEQVIRGHNTDLSVSMTCLPLTLHCLSRALATHSSCLSPTEKFSPFSTTSDSNFSGSWDTWGTDRKSARQVSRCECLPVILQSGVCYVLYFSLRMCECLVCSAGVSHCCCGAEVAEKSWKCTVVIVVIEPTACSVSVLTQSFMWLLSRASQICSSLYWLKGSTLNLETRSESSELRSQAVSQHQSRCPQVILPDCPTEQHWVLRDDWQFAAQVSQSDVTDVNTVNQNGAATALHQPEQSHTQRWLTYRERDRSERDRQVSCCSSWPLQIQDRLLALVLPDPVLPTMPTFSFGRMLQEILLRTRGRFSWYLMSTSWSTSSPCWGQSAGGERPLTRAGASWDRDWETDRIRTYSHEINILMNNSIGELQ